MDGGLGGLGVAVALGDVGAQKGLGVVLDLLVHGGVGLAAELQHRWAAPALVPGAMAATSADSSRKKPAEPARAPAGAT